MKYKINFYNIWRAIMKPNNMKEFHFFTVKGYKRKDSLYFGICIFNFSMEINGYLPWITMSSSIEGAETLFKGGIK